MSGVNIVVLRVWNRRFALIVELDLIRSRGALEVVVLRSVLGVNVAQEWLVIQSLAAA